MTAAATARANVPGRRGACARTWPISLALIEMLGLAPADIVGQSLGSAIVLRLAGERPDLFRSLIVNEPPCWTFWWAAQIGRQSGRFTEHAWQA